LLAPKTICLFVDWLSNREDISSEPNLAANIFYVFNRQMIRTTPHADNKRMITNNKMGEGRTV